MKNQVGNGAIDRFQQQLSIIGKQHTDNTGVISVIKMMQSIGKYLDSRKEDAHKDAVPVLSFIGIELGKLIQSPDLNKEQIHIILSGCIQKFKALKGKIASQPLISSTEMQDLKAVILAIDWEISEITLQTFDQVTSRLLTRLKPHKIHHAFLRIIHSMGRYIASKKAAGNKYSIFFLNSVFENFERIVQTPDMPLKEKQQIIERDIHAFHNFKREIAASKEDQPGSKKEVPGEGPDDRTGEAYNEPPDETNDEAYDEICQPALSHIKSSSKPVAEDIVLLQDSEDPTPALAGRKKSNPPPRDIMDELFSAKESPADELLDEIHLANIQGPEQKRAMNMSAPTEEDLQKKGIKNFTPRRLGNEPIPEIRSRLDAFFSLDISENNNAEEIVTEEIATEEIVTEEIVTEEIVTEDNHGTAIGKNDFNPEAGEYSTVSLPEDGSIETIVPFQYEDDAFEENIDNSDLDEHKPVREAINRLKFLINTHDGLLEENSLAEIDKELSSLKTLWQDDPDKTMLVDMISLLLVKSQASVSDNKPMDDTEDDNTQKSVSVQLNPPPLNFWGKIKSKFLKSK